MMTLNALLSTLTRLNPSGLLEFSVKLLNVPTLLGASLLISQEM
jgi:hypothetical protein